MSLVEASYIECFSKNFKIYFYFYRVRNVLMHEVHVMLYNSLVSTATLYGVVGLSKRFIAQNLFLRAITFSKSKDHSAPLMNSCNMLNIFDINKYMVSTFVYKCVKERISVCED